jgi:hypothetical protein
MGNTAAFGFGWFGRPDIESPVKLRGIAGSHFAGQALRCRARTRIKISTNKARKRLPTIF